MIAFDAAALSPDGEHHKRRQIEAAANDRKAPPKPAALSVVCADNPEAKSNPDERGQHGQGHPGPNSDLCQQWRMAESAEEMANWSLGQLGVTGFEALLVLLATAAAFSAARWAKRAAFAGDEAVKVARDTLSATQRPWVSIITSIDKGFSADKEKMTVSLRIVAQNHGASPAAMMKLQISTVNFIEYTSKFYLEKTNKWSSIYEKNKAAGGNILFPKSNFTYNIAIKLNPIQSGGYRSSTFSHYSPIVIARISYSGVDGVGSYFTDTIMQFDCMDGEARRGFRSDDGFIEANRILMSNIAPLASGAA